MSSRRFTGSDRYMLFLTIAAALVLGYASSLIALLIMHGWIIGANGKPLITDFLEVWVAGRTALQGHAALAYDPQAHHLAQAAMRGQDFAGFLGWHYPPFALFIATTLALLPYAYSFLIWSAATTVAFFFSARAIVGNWQGAMIACAAPCVFVNALVGQNGCFTAAAFAAALSNLRERPILAGFLFGVLAYKPQLGILVPLALIAGGCWRAFLSATMSTILIIAAGWLAFGSTSYAAFFHYLPQTADAVLGHGTSGWYKIQSIYGITRWLGFSNTAALLAQTAIAMGYAIWIWVLWRRPTPFALKASALIFAALLCTPYLYMYDFPLFVLGLAWLYKAAKFDVVDQALIALSAALYCAFIFAAFPLGVPVAILGPILVGRRIRQLKNANSQETHLHPPLQVCAY